MGEGLPGVCLHTLRVQLGAQWVSLHWGSPGQSDQGT